jgi:hypothetical protein
MLVGAGAGTEEVAEFVVASTEPISGAWAAANVAVLAEHHVDQSAAAVDGAVEIAPAVLHFDVGSSGAGQLQPRALSEPDVILSHHPAPIVRPLP